MRLPFEGKNFGCKHHLFATVVRKRELIFLDAGHVIFQKTILSRIFSKHETTFTLITSLVSQYIKQKHITYKQGTF